MTESVAAVVVTFNRKILLSRCVEALLSQTYNLSKIVIIDNASNDGTYEYLKLQGQLNNSIIQYRLLDSNQGGAGGFNVGVATAMDQLPDYLWLMDDDGWPEPECLAKLMSMSGDVRAPLVVDDQDETKTSFGYVANDVRSKEVGFLSQFSSITPAHPFNGVLLSNELILKIGLPDAKFFIWGDELDYRDRWLQAGFDEVVNPKARFFHPSDRQVIQRTNARSLGVPMNCSTLRKYCYYRNQTFLTKKRIGFIKTFGKLFFTLPDIIKFEKNKRVFALASIHGLLEIFGCETRFIK